MANDESSTPSGLRAAVVQRLRESIADDQDPARELARHGDIDVATAAGVLAGTLDLSVDTADELLQRVSGRRLADLAASWDRRPEEG